MRELTMGGLRSLQRYQLLLKEVSWVLVKQVTTLWPAKAPPSKIVSELNAGTLKTDGDRFWVFISVSLANGFIPVGLSFLTVWQG